MTVFYLGDVPVGHEGVEHPEGDVGEEEEGDDLPAGLGGLLGSSRAHSPGSLGDYHSWGGACRTGGHLDGFRYPPLVIVNQWFCSYRFIPIVHCRSLNKDLAAGAGEG